MKTEPTEEECHKCKSGFSYIDNSECNTCAVFIKRKEDAMTPTRTVMEKNLNHLRPVMVYEWVKETSDGLRENKKVEKGKARFHEFGSNPLGTDINFAKTATIAIVEYEDGLVDTVRYNMIRFLDREGSKKDEKLINKGKLEGKALYRAHSLGDARNWFLENSSGSIICVNGEGEELECDNYPDAEKFSNKISTYNGKQ